MTPKEILEKALKEKVQNVQRRLKDFEDIDIELMLTDIKDKKGNKFKLSDEFMELIILFWDYLKLSIDINNIQQVLVFVKENLSTFIWDIPFTKGGGFGFPPLTKGWRIWIFLFY